MLLPLPALFVDPARSPPPPRRRRPPQGDISETAAAIKKRLWDGGLGRGENMTTGKRKTIAEWEDIVLIYAGQARAKCICVLKDGSSLGGPL